MAAHAADSIGRGRLGAEGLASVFTAARRATGRTRDRTSAARVRPLNTELVRRDAEYVLYWSQMNRRARFNHALEFAARRANDLKLPLLVYEGLTFTYPLANDRLHTFILEGVPEMARRLRERGIGYIFYLRRGPSDPGDIFSRLAARAAAVVTDDYPRLPMACLNSKAPAEAGIAAHAVDSSCVVPMDQIGSRQYAAYAIRPKLRKLLDRYLTPVRPVELKREYRAGRPDFQVDVTDSNIRMLVASSDIDHSVPPSISCRGGALFAENRLENFLTFNLRRYARERNLPSARATSELSPYLHYGHISSLEVALRAKEYAERHGLVAQEFLEELIVRRELAFNFARYSERVDTLDALPEWARKTLRRHARDRRPAVYSREEFINAETGDALWNATQREMLLRGLIHPYYRMYWGKKIIEWSRTYEEALETMLYVHHKFALDGRDPNTYANILWCFGLHDRPWPERPVFGAVRAMTLEGMERKTNTDAYIRQIEDLWKSR